MYTCYSAPGKFNVWTVLNGEWVLLSDELKSPYEFDTRDKADEFIRKTNPLNARRDWLDYYIDGDLISKHSPVYTSASALSFGKSFDDSINLFKVDASSHKEIKKDIDLAYNKKVLQMSNPISLFAVLLTLPTSFEASVFFTHCLAQPDLKKCIVLCQTKENVTKHFRQLYVKDDQSLDYSNLRAALAVFNRTLISTKAMVEQFGFSPVNFS
jgi:hypothetical protein